PRGVLERDVAVASLLKQPAECRVIALELLERGECIPRTVLLALGEREQIERLPVRRHCRDQSLRNPGGLDETPRLEKLADVRDLGAVGGRGLCGCARSAHGPHKRRRASCPPSSLAQPAAAARSVPAPAGQKPHDIVKPSTRGRSGISALMNWAEEVNVLALELLRFVPYTMTRHRALAMPICAS